MSSPITKHLTILPKLSTLDRTIHVMDNVAKGLTLRSDVHVEVTSRNHPGGDAYTDGTTIYLSEDLVAKLSNGLLSPSAVKKIDLARQIAVLKGIMYHEAGHCLYSPRSGTKLIRMAVNMNVMYPYLNVLEDQRMEMLDCRVHPGHKPFLVAAMEEYIVRNSETGWEDNAHVWIHGRRYLPQAMRDIARDSYYAGPAVASEVSDVIDEYLTLTFPSGTDRGVELALKLKELMAAPDKDGNTPPRPDYDFGPTNHPVDRKSGNVEPEREQQKIKGEDGPAEDADYDDDEGDDTDADNGDVPADSHDASDGAAGDEEPPEGEISDNAPENDGSPLDTPVSSTRDMADALKESTDKFLEDQADDLVDNFRKSVKGASTNDRGKDSGKATAPVPASAMGIPRRLSKPLIRMADKFRPAWRSRKEQGTVNALDYRTRRPGERTFYDQYRKGQSNAAGVDVVIVLDASMSTNMSVVSGADLDISHYASTFDLHQAARVRSDIPGFGSVLDYECLAAWAVKRAVDALPGGNCSVLAFGEDGNDQYMYRSHEKASPDKYIVPASDTPEALGAYRWETLGSTHPVTALRRAAKDLEASPNLNKFVIIITDGQWDMFSQSPSHDTIDQLNAAGVTTALFGVGPHGQSVGVVEGYGDHHCKVAKDIPNILDLPAAVSALVADALVSRSSGK